ncbi:MAG: hypothetical protein D6798_00375 [Deltaproteobacteria bacterium]|nr:MAG: hypothetical protein D6798_00375 [Deltaproteobacteria bacterium]
MRIALRTPRLHGQKLKGDLASVAQAAATLAQDRSAAGVPVDQGIVLQFDSEPGFELSLTSLDRRGDGIELLAVRQRARAVQATVFVPDGKLTVFERLIDRYANELTQRGRPKNERLVANIAAVRLAVLESFWTDEGELPEAGTPMWWEVWLRRAAGALTTFRDLAERSGMQVGDRHLSFIDREVVLAHGTREQLTSSVRLLDTIAEVRKAKELASFFDALPAAEQAEWIASLWEGMTPPPPDAPAVCLLDTGVQRGHPLLEPLLAPGDLHAVDRSWGVSDHSGHGTQMAGLAAWGDLAPALAGDVVEPPEHRLESVVLLPPRAATPTPPELYGAYTAASVALPEIVAPQRPRVFCMTVTTNDDRDRGRPSSWSAEVDLLSHGGRDGYPRLFVVSAGNVEPETRWTSYPDINDTEQIHDPGQAWNALTVGAMTDKAWFDPGALPGWRPIAPPGALSPCSTTSVTWASPWPNKPDVVMEGGNGAVSPSGDVDLPADLCLLSTSRDLLLRQLEPTGQTSAAAALVARMAARLMCAYPRLWPETVRALIVHSARWTAAMKASVRDVPSPSKRLRTLVRRFGWGQPDFGRASASAQNALTLVAQRSLRPFHDTAESGRAPQVKTRDWHLFNLPWPRTALLDLGEVEVELRVTLSFFVEPNPGRRGQMNRHRYQSCALRFAMQRSDEGLDEFRARVSKNEQNEEAGLPSFSERGWLLGPGGRDRGSILSDIWTGTAAELALRDHLAIYPVGGWWRHNIRERRWDDSVRYALVLSIHAPEADVDIYTPVATEVGISIEV